ncbi:hypothetical protein OC835_003478 [Tilletia horrida]|nr:hypothetical protein OC835_003478 [Tilletia horrida]
MPSSSSSFSSHSGSLLSPSTALDALKSLYTRAPTSAHLLLTFLASYTFTLARADYAKFIAIGNGGLLPYNALGWIMSLLMRPIVLSPARMINPNALPAPEPADTFLPADLPTRAAPRPTCYGIAPQRQLDGISPHKAAYTTALNDLLAELVSAEPDKMYLAPSSLEGGSIPALFCSACSSTSAGVAAGGKGEGEGDGEARSPTAKLYLSGMPKGEFAHIHRHDGSVHVVLSPADARAALDKGWGQLHSLSGLAYRGFWLPSLLRTWRPPPTASHNTPPRRALGPPPTYTFLYAPRSDAELETVKTLIRAAARFSAGVGGGAA